jgi:hypothetical protein
VTALELASPQPPTMFAHGTLSVLGFGVMVLDAVFGIQSEGVLIEPWEGVLSVNALNGMRNIAIAAIKKAYFFMSYFFVLLFS